jgi:PPOX class probable F420-dependent enzyme
VDPAQARSRFLAVPVARLATADAEGRPHVVPITFALLGEATLVSAVDHKPKRTTALRRLANIASNPRVCVLADHYSDDWSTLWWARADGTGRVLDAGEEPELRAAATNALQRRYPAYHERRPDGAIVVMSVERWSGWSAE